MQYCRFCINKDKEEIKCKECGKDGKNFIPTENIRKYFKHNYNRWYYNTSNGEITQTQGIIINDSMFCPYCTEEMLHLQDNNLEVIGRCCLCDGALNEMQYTKEAAQLKEEYNQKENELKVKYTKLLQYDLNGLFIKKQKIELKRFEFFNKNSKCNKFLTINGAAPIKIDELLF